MRTRVLPALRRPVSEIGLGGWQLGGDWRPVDDRTAMRILQTAVDNDIDFVDTADAYGAGRSETLIGRFMRSTGVRLFVATKVGRFPDPGGRANLEPDVMRRHVEASMRRLGVRCLDLVQLHCIDRRTIEETGAIATLLQMRDEGRIRCVGASVETLEDAAWCMDRGVQALQVIFNVLRQDAAESILERARRSRVAIIARLPLLSGALGGRMSGETRFGPEDHRNYNRDGAAFHVGETFGGIPFPEAVELAAEIKKRCPPGYTPAEFALRWILDHEAVTCVIPGATHPDQVFENAGASDLPRLGEDLHAELAAFYRERVRPRVRGGI